MTAAEGGPRRWLRAEGLLAFVAGLAVYNWLDHSWLLFIILFLTPDISFLAYVAGPRAGAATYNFVHTYSLPLALGLTGIWLGASLPVALSLIWIAHIGLDRSLGYGLKYASGFRETHLGRVGKASKVTE